MIRRPRQLFRKRTLGISLVSVVFFAGLSAPFSTGPPARRTGAPGDTGTCNDIGCHNSFTLNSGSGNVSITAPAEYQPGQATDMTVTVTDPSAVLFGFEITAKDASNQNTGTWELTDANSQFALESSDYVEHDNAAGGIGNHAWSVRWIASAAQAGDVTFYAAGNAANGDGTNQGDRIYTSSITLSPGTATSVTSEELPESFAVTDVFPNPFTEYTTLRYSVHVASRLSFELYDVSGRLLQSESFGMKQAGEHEFRVSSGALPGGILFYRLFSDMGETSGRIILVR